jgi:hypothetical protein
MVQVTEEFEEQATDFQREVLGSVELLWTAAQNKKGRGFNPAQINHIAGYLNSLSVALMQHEQAKVAYDRMLDAYFEEYGRELFDKIMAGDEVEGEVIEQVLESTGQRSETAGTDAPSQGEESGTLPEVADDTPATEEG